MRGPNVMKKAQNEDGWFSEIDEIRGAFGGSFIFKMNNIFSGNLAKKNNETKEKVMNKVLLLIWKRMLNA